MIRGFLISDKKLEKDAFAWNMMGSMLYAFQSVIMLMVLTRVLGLVDAGVFTIAYANANLFLNVGKYGMRYFQSSDIRHEYSFFTYTVSRVFTTVLMIIISLIYTFNVAGQNGYSQEKIAIIIWMTILKVADSIEDVYHGHLQANNRLDIASKCMTIRLAGTIIIYVISLVLLRNQLYALVISTVSTYVIFIYLTVLIRDYFSMSICKAELYDVQRLLKKCFPLFVGAFLSFYIGNAPKYAIDAIMSDEIQACYGFIAMPVFVVGLINSFIFNPLLYKMSSLWDDDKIGEFIKLVIRQVFILCGITIICIIGAWILGVPVLSFLYNTDLSNYKVELIILLLGGGFLGLSGFLTAIITIIRRQDELMWCYLLVSIIAFFSSKKAVATGGIYGASLIYTVLMLIICITFLFIFIKGIRARRKKKL